MSNTVPAIPFEQFVVNSKDVNCFTVHVASPALTQNMGTCDNCGCHIDHGHSFEAARRKFITDAITEKIARMTRKTQ